MECELGCLIVRYSKKNKFQILSQTQSQDIYAAKYRIFMWLVYKLYTFTFPSMKTLINKNSIFSRKKKSQLFLILFFLQGIYIFRVQLSMIIIIIHESKNNVRRETLNLIFLINKSTIKRRSYSLPSSDQNANI